MKQFFSPSPIYGQQGLAIVRMALGALMIYHGIEVFNSGLMKSYMEWESFRGANAAMLVYAGKSSELLAGISIFFGLATRFGALLTMGTLSYVTFVVGQGRFWYEDQHPFMFVLFGLLLLFTGPGSWSLDGILFKRNDQTSV